MSCSNALSNQLVPTGAHAGKLTLVSEQCQAMLFWPEICQISANLVATGVSLHACCRCTTVSEQCRPQQCSSHQKSASLVPTCAYCRPDMPKLNLVSSNIMTLSIFTNLLTKLPISPYCKCADATSCQACLVAVGGLPLRPTKDVIAASVMLFWPEIANFAASLQRSSENSDNLLFPIELVEQQLCRPQASDVLRARNLLFCSN